MKSKLSSLTPSLAQSMLIRLAFIVNNGLQSRARLNRKCGTLEKNQPGLQQYKFRVHQLTNEFLSFYKADNTCIYVGATAGGLYRPIRSFVNPPQTLNSRASPVFRTSPYSDLA